MRERRRGARVSTYVRDGGHQIRLLAKRVKRGWQSAGGESRGGAIDAPLRMKDIAGWCVRLVSTFVPKRDLMVFASFDGYASNARAFYEAVVREDLVSQTVWLSLGPQQHSSLEAFSVPHVPLASTRGLWLVMRARWIVSTHGEIGRFRALRGQGYVNLWHGLPFKNGGYLWSEDEGDQLRESVQRCDVMPCSSPFTKAVLASVFHIKADRIHPTGLPRNDPLVDRESARDRLRAFLGDTDFDRAVLYCPTHRQILGGRPESSWTFDDFREKYLVDELSDVLRRHRILLLMKLHPFDERRAAGEVWQLPENVRLLTVQDLVTARVELYEILGGFDALWSDYSSIAVDYLLTGQPIFYIVDDLEEYLEGRGVVLDDFPFLAPGPHIQSLGDLLQAIDEWVLDPSYFKEEREKLAGIMHSAMPPFAENLVDVLRGIGK